jgi:hypothetical protein
MLGDKFRIWLTVAAVVMLCFSACKQGSESGKPATERTEAGGMLGEYAEWANAPDAEEARQWFAKPAARFWNESSLNIPALVEELYRMGAKRVVVIGITREQDVELAAALLVELPADTSAREKLFAHEQKMAELTGDPPIKDTGQQYLHYAFD